MTTAVALACETQRLLGDAGTRDESSPPSTPRAEKAQVLAGLPEVEIDKEAHVCFVLPIIPPDGSSSDDGIDWKKPVKTWMAQSTVVSRFSFTAPGSCTPPDHAKKLFRDWEVYPGQEALNEAFGSVTTFQEYSSAFRKFFLAKLQSTDCGLLLRSDYSVDLDEVFLKVTVPAKGTSREVPTNIEHVCAVGEQAAQPAAKVMATRAELLAANFAIRMPFSEQAYGWAKEHERRHDVKVEVPKDDDIFYPAYAPFTLRKTNGLSPFQALDDKQLIRLAYLSIREFFDLSELLRQQQIVTHFPVHKHEQCEKLREHWGRLTPSCTCNSNQSLVRRLCCGMVPSHGPGQAWDDELKDYFGEKVAFLFFFLTSYTSHLRLPAFMGALLFFRRWLPTLEEQRMVQTAFAIFMTLWAAVFCKSYLREERARVIRWGARALDQRQETKRVLSTYCALNEDQWITADEAERLGLNPRWMPLWRLMGIIRAACHPSRRGTKQFNPTWLKVRLFKLLGSSVFLCVLAGVVSGVICIQCLRISLRRKPELYVDRLDWLWAIWVRLGWGLNHEERLEQVRVIGGYVGVLLITIQIRVLDYIWDIFARWVVSKENHRTVDMQSDALIGKLYFVKLINLMYPYIYIVFIKEHVDGCLQRGCVVELQDSLFTFFVTNALCDFAFAGYSWCATLFKVKQEMAKTQAKGKPYTYLQIQAKLDPASPRLDDMLPLVVQFAFVCSFTIACPAMPLMALVYNTVMGKFALLRRLKLEKRCFPSTCEGIGIWASLLDTSKTLCCVINVGIAVFAMHPIKDWDLTRKLTAFIALEHVMLLIVVSINLLHSNNPSDATRLEEYNQEVLPLLLNPEQQVHCRSEAQVVPEHKPVTLEEIAPEVQLSKLAPPQV